WRDPEYGHRLRQVRALRAAHPDQPLVVALGSSRTQMGVSPADMGFADAPGSPLVYSFGRSGAGPLLLNLTFRRLLDDGVRPDFQWTQLDGRGWTPYPFAAVSAADRAKGIDRVRRDYQPTLSAYRVGPSSDRVLRDLLGECRAAGIPAALYLTPEGPAFAGWY